MKWVDRMLAYSPSLKTDEEMRLWPRVLCLGISKTTHCNGGLPDHYILSSATVKRMAMSAPASVIQTLRIFCYWYSISTITVQQSRKNWRTWEHHICPSHVTASFCFLRCTTVCGPAALTVVDVGGVITLPGCCRVTVSPSCQCVVQKDKKKNYPALFWFGVYSK